MFVALVTLTKSNITHIYGINKRILAAQNFFLMVFIDIIVTVPTVEVWNAIDVMVLSAKECKYLSIYLYDVVHWEASARRFSAMATVLSAFFFPTLQCRNWSGNSVVTI